MKVLKDKIIKIIIITTLFIVILIGKTNAFTIVLDPGHGGNDSGAVNNKRGLKEAEINYKIATYLASFLNRYKGVTVLKTRSGNEYKSLKQRANVAINNKADLFMSIHINASSSGKPTGACSYVTYKKDLPKYNKNCTALSKLILANLNQLGIKNNGVKTRICSSKDPAWMYADGTHADYYGVIRYCMKGTRGDGEALELDIAAGESIPAILVEHCYINNGDEQYIDSDEYIARIAKCDLNGIVSYYGLEFDKEKETEINKLSIGKPQDVIYTGKNVTTKLSIKDGKYELIPGIDYQVSYKNNKNVGTATITITGKDFYKGTITKTFKILPGKTNLTSVKNTKKKSAKITWKKDTEVDGYEIYMAKEKVDKHYQKTTAKINLRKSPKTSAKSLLKIPSNAKVKILKKNAKKANGYTWSKVSYKGKKGYVPKKYLKDIHSLGSYSKTKTIKNNKTTSYTKTKLKKKKTYYFKVRSYKTIDGKKVYGDYSKVKSVKIKK